jgi:ribose 5-phosphate isomerase A
MEKPPVSPEDLERVAAQALSFVPDGPAGARVGLGSGRAAVAFVRALAGRAKAGLKVQGVPTSEATAALAREVGIPLIELDQTPLDLTVDGADEVDPNLDMVKGWGGALVRERIVAAASRRQIILITPDKLVPKLGSRGHVPVEVNPFARAFVERRLLAIGCRPEMRMAGGKPFITDNGNLTLDCGLEPPDDAAALDRKIRAIPGVVDTGFFLGTAETVLLAEAGAVRALRRGESRG